MRDFIPTLPRIFRLGSCLTLGAFVFLPGARSAGAPDSLTLVRQVPADAVFVVHLRNTAELVENWQYTPFARMWQEPQVRKFLAPAVEKFTSETAGPFAELQQEVGLTPAELFDLFSGEMVMALLKVPPDDAENAMPEFMLGVHLGENREKFLALMEKAHQDEPPATEEFQGETLTTETERGDDGSRTPVFTWALLDDVVWMANPKEVLQATLARIKGGDGGFASVSDASDFAGIYRRHPEAQLGAYVNMASIVAIGTAKAEAEAAAKAQAQAGGDGDAGAASAPAGAGGMLGMTPGELMHALGLDALRGLVFSAGIRREASTWDVGISWSEPRGLIKLVEAYGEPAPRPDFASDSWYSVSAARFSIPQAFAALKATAAAANPMFEVMIQQYLANLNQALGIDLEQDFIGSMGDEFMQAADERRAPDGSINPLQPADQLWSLALANAETFNRSVDALLSKAPPAVRSFITDREYLGQIIHTFALPTAAGAGTGGAAGAMRPISYAITPRQLLVSVGSADMIETAIQGMNGTGHSVWTLPDVRQAIGELPPGGSSVTYTDMRRGVNLFFDVITGAAASLGRTPAGGAGRRANAAAGLGSVIDPAAKPDPELLEKYWSWAAGALYRDSLGVHVTGRLKHVEVE